MANISSSLAAGTANVNLGDLLVAGGSVVNVPMPLADTEYSYAFGSGTKGFIFQNRSSGLLKLSFASGASGTTYFSLFPGTQIWKDNLDGSGFTLYFQSPTAAQTAEVVKWS